MRAYLKLKLRTCVCFYSNMDFVKPPGFIPLFIFEMTVLVVCAHHTCDGLIAATAFFWGPRTEGACPLVLEFELSQHQIYICVLSSAVVVCCDTIVKDKYTHRFSFHALYYDPFLAFFLYIDFF